MHARGQNEKWRITANRLETRRVACAIVIQGCRSSSTVPTLRHQPCVVVSGSKTLTAKRGMRKVAKAIKGTSTHAIDRKLHSHEAVWQEESFDHVLRSSESLDAKIDYVLQNPVRKGLVRIASEYPWSWRKPMDHQDRSRRGWCPHPPTDAEHRKTLAGPARQPGRGRPGLREPWWLGAVKVQSRTEIAPKRSLS